MLSVEGINIKHLPFDGLQVLQEIIEFEGIPVLVHYSDNRKNDVISYLVDFDANGRRLLYGKITKQELFEYFIGTKSLKLLFSDISSDFIFLADYDKKGNLLLATLLSKFMIPEKYLPVDESYNTEEINDYYLNYLKEFYYNYKLKLNSFIVKVESSTKVHGKTVGARETAIVLNHTSSSVEGYIRTKSFNILKKDFGDANKIKKRITNIKNFLSPRIADARPGSVEIWLAIDTQVFHGSDKYEIQIKENLIEGYKQDVLDVDYTSESDAKMIAEKYTEDERKMIFEPIYKLLENEDFIISISDPKKTLLKNNKELKSSETFWKTLLPPPTVQKLQEEEEKKHRIVTLVLNLREGQNITRLTKKSLQDNLLFTQESAETIYSVSNPILVDGVNIILKKPIKCILTIDQNNHLQLFNEKLEIIADGEGDSFDEVVESIKKQFFYLVRDLKNIEDTNYPKAQEIKQYIE